MRIGSLFSGIGGLERGLEVAGLGHTVWQVEVDGYCREVLAKHWPDAERFSDVRSVGASTLVPVDLICGGFPCQDISSAGKRAGLAGARSGLWFEYLRIVRELRPSWVVVENVASGARAWVDAVLEGLGAQGYSCLPVPVAAADVGAPHERRRIFIVATNAHEDRKHTRAINAEMALAPQSSTNSNSSELRHEHGRTSRAFRKGPSISAVDRKEVAANADCSRLGSGSRTHWARLTQATDGHWYSAQPDMVRMVHGVSRGLDKPSKRIGALGNAVVPQCAEVIGHVIMELAR
jgi:DNA (cytosine-5)-methyltransferase 1